MNEKRLDVLLEEGMDMLFPDEACIKQISPWRKPLEDIVKGMLLCCFRLNLLYLQYILPTLGVFFLYRGFRSLRKENGFFHAAWILALTDLLSQPFYLVLEAGPWLSAWKDSLLPGVLTGLFSILRLLLLRQGLRCAFQKGQLSYKEDPLLLAALWYTLSMLLALSPFSSSWLAAIGMLILFGLMLSSLFKLIDAMEDRGYCLKNARLRIGDSALKRIYLWTCLLLSILSMLFGNHMPAKGEVREAEQEKPKAYEMLLALDLSREILDDLSLESLEALNDPILVIRDGSLLRFAEKRDTKGDLYMVGKSERKEIIYPGNVNLQADTIYIETADGYAYFLHCFSWEEGKAFWNDGFTISSHGDMELVEGKLLYEKDGLNYEAPIPRLICSQRTVNGFFGSQREEQITGGVSFPFGSEAQRGYVLYRSKLKTEADILSSVFRYSHMQLPLRLPYVAAEEGILNGSRKSLLTYYSFESKGYREMTASKN